MPGVLFHSWLLLLVVLWVYGLVARWVERARFRVTMMRHAYWSHGQYVGGPEWHGRRRRFVADQLRRRCWRCGRGWQIWFPVHHVDYSRAGGGREAGRDLRLLCEGCHGRVHWWDRRLRGLGVTLRAASWVAWAVAAPQRLVRWLWVR